MQSIVHSGRPGLTRYQVTGVLAVGGAATGSIALALVFVIGDLLHGTNPLTKPTIYAVPALMGAVFGVWAAPLAGWMFFRSAPLGRTALTLAVATVVGAVVGEWMAPFNPQGSAPPGVAIGGVVGVLLGALATRWMSVRARRISARAD